MKFGAKIITTAIMACVANLALANQAILVNGSPMHGPITLKYKIAHKNSGGATVFSGPQTITFDGIGKATFDLEGYELAGIVPISVNEVVIPDSETEFDMPQRCSLTTDVQRPSGTLGFRFESKSDGHGKLVCFVTGGVFN